MSEHIYYNIYIFILYFIWLTYKKYKKYICIKIKCVVTVVDLGKGCTIYWEIPHSTPSSKEQKRKRKPKSISSNPFQYV